MVASYNLGSQAEIEATADRLADSLISVFGKDVVMDRVNALGIKPVIWPLEYVNRETGKAYKPHSDAEHVALYDTAHRHLAALGGEGGGKSVWGIRRDIERLKAGCSGILVSPDLPHFKKSLWPEFARWCPWDMVHPKHQNMADPIWSPYQPFHIVFRNGAMLYCGGMDEPGSWEGPNVNFAHFDEARRKKEADALKVLDGRVRIPGPNGEPPQIWITTTPRKHWLYEFYGPLNLKCLDCGKDLKIEIQSGKPEVCDNCSSTNLKCTDTRELFKRDSLVFRLYTEDNEENLEQDFARKRSQTLTAAEARVLLRAEWEDIEEGQPFLPSMLWWDDCKGDVPILGKDEPLVISVDAATGRQTEESDCFAIVGLTRHPEDKTRTMVRYVNTWQAPAGGKIDYQGSPHNPGPERELLRLCGWTIDDSGTPVKVGDGYNVKCIAYDPRDLHDLGQRFRRKRVAYMKEFGQVKDRTESDTDLLRVIQEKRMTHDGNAVLREHIANADRKLDDSGHHLRIVKREDALKIDAAICLSMGNYTCLHLNL